MSDIQGPKVLPTSAAALYSTARFELGHWVSMNVNERYSFELTHLFARGASFCPDKTKAGSLQHTHILIFMITQTHISAKL